MKARRGTPTAGGATAHNLAPLGYRFLKYGEASGAQGRGEDAQAYRERGLQHLARQAKALGSPRLSTRERPAQEVPA
ncbi:MAG TPA: hypothetical protein VGX03_29225 [Candidatus Binatia bacterium]|nr:hypothetical protein [Candidatus Binatia bacterium]